MSVNKEASGEKPFQLGECPGASWTVTAEMADLSRPAPPMRRLELPAQPKRLAVDANKCALLVVDMQNDFCTAGGWLDHIGVDYRPARGPIAPLQRLLPALRSAAVPVIWVNWGNRADLMNISPALRHVYKPEAAAVGLGEPVPATGARVLELESWGAAIVDELQPVGADIHVRKYRMSGFWDTELDSILRNLGVSTCLFAGVNADQCVLHTLADANFLGYDTVLLEDCTATTSPDFCWQATIYNARQIFGFTALSGDLMRALGPAED
ncbi:MAG: isochorismatase family protein [Ectothiorhodospiraceae bacterium]|nr:isochorismatase family protein [Ectothiorhodospiraceae bacterium]MCH8505161.1 cysteine hydrolase [Ectothiorhodospiraceae bacterium]